MKRLKNEQIYKMDGCRNISQNGSSVQHPIFCGQDFIDIQDRVSYTDSHKKEVLINCDLPERKGDFHGTIDVAAGQMRIVYNRVTLEYKMEFKSMFSAELVCWQTDRQETPGYVLELKHSSQSPVQSGK